MAFRLDVSESLRAELLALDVVGRGAAEQLRQSIAELSNSDEQVIVLTAAAGDRLARELRRARRSAARAERN